MLLYNLNRIIVFIIAFDIYYISTKDEQTDDQIQIEGIKLN